MRTKLTNRLIAFFAVIMMVFTLIPSSLYSTNVAYAQDEPEISANGDLNALNDGDNQPSESELQTIVSSILDAKKGKEGDEYTVIGVVVFIDGRGIYIEDETSGIDAFFAQDKKPEGLVLGDKIKVTGKYKNYQGLIELENVQSYEKLESDCELPSTQVTLKKLIDDTNATENKDSYQCKRVSLKGLKIDSINYSGNSVFSQDGVTMNVYKMPTNNDLQVGDVIDAVAVVGMHNNNIQLRISRVEDITVVKKAEPTEPISEPTGDKAFKKISTIDEIGEGGEFIIYGVVGDKERAMGNTLTSGRLNVVEVNVDKENNQIINSDQSIVWSFVKLSDGTYTIQNAATKDYVYINNDNTSAIVFDKTPYYSFNVILEKGIFYLLSTHESARGFSIFNSTSDVQDFRSYKKASCKILDLYKLDTNAQPITDLTEPENPTVPEVPTVQEDPTVPAEIIDPIGADLIAEGVKTIAEINALPTTGSKETVIGQVVYKYGNCDKINTTMISDVIDGEIVGLQIYNACTNLNIGDIVTISGEVAEYGTVRQISSISETKVLVPSSEVSSVIPYQEVTITELLANIDKYLSEVVLIKDVTLGEYSNKDTKITDTVGKYINIYQAATFPQNVVAGDVVDLVAVASKYNATVQLRVGNQASYKLAGAYDVNEDILQTVFKFTGSTYPTSTPVYADLEQENDYADTATTLTLSTGAIPQIINTNDGVKTGAIGSKGLSEGQYYLISTSSSKLANLELSFQMKGSGTGARDFKISYSTDGTNFTSDNVNVHTYGKFPVYVNKVLASEKKVDDYRADGTFKLEEASKYHDINVILPTEAANAENLLIKVEVASLTSIKGETIGTGGTNYFTSIKCVANPIISDEFTQPVVLTSQDNTAIEGGIIELSTATNGATIYYSYNNSDFQVYDVANKPVYNDFPARIVAFATKDGRQESIKTTYVINKVQVATVKATPNGGAVNVGSKVRLTCSTEGATIYYSFDGENFLTYEESIILAALPTTITVKATKDGYLESATTKLNFTKRENEEYNIYFGQIHSHTNISDGAGTLEAAYNHAYNEAEQVDFLAVTDHSNSFDNDTQASITDGSCSPEWVNAKQYAKDFTTKVKENVAQDSSVKDFVAIYGYEMTWSGGTPGHMNTYNTEGFLSRNMNGYKNASKESLPNYYAMLKTVPESMSMFNHPGSTFGDFEDFGYYDEEMDNLITLIEVGNGEGAIGSSGYFPSYSYYTRALDKGWHIAPANNQDNHKGMWGDANTGRTVVLADSLTEENIYDAIRNRRVYATEDNDFKLTYKLNGYDMGHIFEDEQSEVEISIKVEDPTDNVDATVEVIVNGGIVAANGIIKNSNGSLDFNLEPNYSYYYIRVVQKDGDIIVSAPVWIGEVEAIGISNVSTNTALPVKNEALEITTSFFNNEKLPLTVESLTFSIDDEVIHTADLEKAGLTSLDALSQNEYKFNYTHEKVGNVEIKAEIKGTLNGVNKSYVGNMKLCYVDPTMVTTIIVDGTHYNDYVTGYYSGNTKNITKLAAQSNVKIQVVEDKITKEMLDNCQLLIISAPGKKTDYGVSHFEDDFIALVKEYVDNGGDVIFCGLADYQDTADGQTTTEINKVLEAIGATTRLNADEAMDDEKNGGQNFRIYPSIFNFESPFTNGIIHGNEDETANQTYSAYSGCTVALDEEAVAAGKATWLVKGFETTYSASTKTYAGLPGGNLVVVNKGDVVFLAHEKINNSNIFVSGTVFMSDFEVKELDSAADLPYANQNIVTNIINNVKVQTPISTIAEMRQGAFGEVYAIEGYVTAGTAVAGNAFFDTIYVQDETGGTTVFPFAKEGIKIGTKIRLVGFVDEYQGDKELQIASYEILDDTNLNIIAPTNVSTKEAADYDKLGGMLLKVQGKVTRIVTNEAGVDYFFVADESGVEARVFVDGYILASNGVDKVNDIVKVGNTISAVGLSYFNPDGPCLRTRDRAEIILVSEGAGSGNTSQETNYVIVPATPSENDKADELANINDKEQKDDSQKSDEKTPSKDGTIEVIDDADSKTPEGDGEEHENVVLDVIKTVNAKKNATIKDSIKELMKNDSELNAIAVITDDADKDYQSASLTINVKKIEEIKVGDSVYVYRYNEETGKYEELLNSLQEVKKGKKVSLDVAEDGLYVVTNKELDSSVVKTVKEQIAETITVKGKNKATINTAKTKSLKISANLPENITSQVNEEDLTISYKSLNKDVATVTKNGKVKATAAGTAKIRVTVKLNGVVISTKIIKVTVK